MSRFQHHRIRAVTSLDGTWDFVYLGDVDPDCVNLVDLAFEDRMAVPGCFDATPKYAGKRGLAAYRMKVALTERAHYRLVFQSVHHWCRVFANGQALRDHIGGFGRFSANLPTQEPGILRDRGAGG